jgi:hypothetical protein
VVIGITSPEYEQLTVTYHLSGSMGSLTLAPNDANAPLRRLVFALIEHCLQHRYPASELL